MVVTDYGVAVNPRRSDLKARLVAAGLPVRDIADLKKAADEAVGEPQPAQVSDRNVAVVEYRDGTLIDVVRQLAG